MRQALEGGSDALDECAVRGDGVEDVYFLAAGDLEDHGVMIIIIEKNYL